MRYFFAKGRVIAGMIKIEHMPTEAMLADFFTKPLQGRLFRKFQNLLMNLGHGNTEEWHALESVLKNENENRVNTQKSYRKVAVINAAKEDEQQAHLLLRIQAVCLFSCLSLLDWRFGSWLVQPETLEKSTRGLILFDFGSCRLQLELKRIGCPDKASSSLEFSNVHENKCKTDSKLIIFHT